MVKKAKETKTDDSKLFAFLAVFLGIIGFVIALLTKKEDKYVMHYAKQSLVLTIFAVCVWIIYTILAGIITLITFGFGIFLVAPIGIILWLAVVILWVIGWIYALSNEMKYIPFIGKFADKFNL